MIDPRWALLRRIKSLGWRLYVRYALPVVTLACYWLQWSRLPMMCYDGKALWAPPSASR